MTKHFTLFFTTVLLFSTVACNKQQNTQTQPTKTQIPDFKVTVENFATPSISNGDIDCPHNINTQTDYCILTEQERSHMNEEYNAAYDFHAYMEMSNTPNGKLKALEYLQNNTFVQTLKRSYQIANNEEQFFHTYQALIDIFKNKGIDWLLKVGKLLEQPFDPPTQNLVVGSVEDPFFFKPETLPQIVEMCPNIKEDFSNIKSSQVLFLTQSNFYFFSYPEEGEGDILIKSEGTNGFLPNFRASIFINGDSDSIWIDFYYTDMNRPNQKNPIPSVKDIDGDTCRQLNILNQITV